MRYVLYHYAYSSVIKIALYFLEAWKVVQKGNHFQKEREREGKEAIKKERARLLASFSKESNKWHVWIIPKPSISCLYLPEDLLKNIKEMF